jgi:peptide chain release factor 2
MRDRQQLVDQIETIQTMETELDDAIGLIELAEEEGDEEIVAEAGASLKVLHKQAQKLQIETLLSGEADGNDTYLEVHAGAGGTESQD